MSDRYALIAVYIMASRPFGVLYTGVASNPPSRVYRHREGLVDGFTREYGCRRLVWYEQLAATAPEKAIKHYVRAWKLNLVERMNPEWRDLYLDLA